VKIAPYLANTVQRTYQRQQRIGERIAQIKSRDAQEGPRPAAQVELSQAGLQASRASRSDLEKARAAHLDDLSERFVERFLATLDREASGEEAPPESEAAQPGQPSFDRVLDNLGLAVERDPESGEGRIVEKESKRVLISVPPEATDAARADLRNLARDILSDLV